MDATVIAFASGKGGTGKSTAAVFVGAALAAQGKKVVLVELVQNLRSIDIITGTAPLAVFDLEDVLSGNALPGKAMVESPLYPGLFVIPAAYKGGRITPQGMQLLCSRFSQSYDYILLDVAPGLGAAMAGALAVAGSMVLVETADYAALRAGRLLADTVGDLPIAMRLLLNKVNPTCVLQESGLLDLDEAIDSVGLQLLGVIPQSTAIHRAVVSGSKLLQDSLEADVFTAVACRIMGADIPLLIR